MKIKPSVINLYFIISNQIDVCLSSKKKRIKKPDMYYSGCVNEVDEKKYGHHFHESTYDIKIYSKLVL